MLAAIAVPFMTIAVKHLELGIFTAEPKPAATYAATNEVGPQQYENHLPDLAPSVPAESKKTGLPLSKILLVGWTAVSVIFLTRLLLTFILGIHLVKKSQPFKYPKIAESMKAAASKLGIKENMSVYSSKSVSSPAIWCWKRRPILLLPSDKRLLNDKIDLVGILCHELAHVKRRDHVAGLLSELMVVFLPWHPLSWWAKKRLLSLSENACDDWVIAAGSCGMNYAESLLDLLPAKQMAFVPTVVRNKDVLKRRVMRMLRESYENPRLDKKWILSSVLITICISLSVAFAQTKSAGPEEKETLENAPSPASVSQVVPQISGEAQIALVEAQRRFEANPEDLASAREPLVEYVETYPEDSVPLMIYQMLGQFWYIDEQNNKHIEEAQKVYKAGYEAFPEDDGMLLNYSVTTYELANESLNKDDIEAAKKLIMAAAGLFEEYYNLNEKHEAKYLEYAAASYIAAGNLTEAKRVSFQLVDSTASPEARWFDIAINLCQETEDSENEEYYIHQAMDFYPSEDKFKKLLANEYFEQGEDPSGKGAFAQTRSVKSDVDKNQATSHQLTATAYQMFEVDTPPGVLRTFPPPYPKEAKDKNVQGRGVLQFIVDTDGIAKEPRVVKVEPEEASIFKESALEAIVQYQFKPATINGEDVLCIVKLPIAFTLE